MPLTLACALALTLSACGGGGEASDAYQSATSAASAAPTSQPVAATAAPETSDSLVSVPTWFTPSHLREAVGVVADMKALGASAAIAFDGISESPTPASASPIGVGTRYYIDSNTGNDGADGLAATATGVAQGPWRTLARLMKATLNPGDTVVLACGSTWSETLRLPVSGTADRPVLVTASSAQCPLPPTIEGAVPLVAAAWSRHQGPVFKTALAIAPLQVTASTATLWTEAHHPNRGYLASNPANPYLATAADSPVVTVNNEPASTSLVTGRDLQLPSGVQLAGARVGIRVYGWWYEDHVITSQIGNRLAFSGSTLFPVTAGRGYYLKGQLWMADSDGEWAYDAASRTLFAYMPGGVVPTEPLQATVLATGVDLQGRNHVTLDGLAVKRTGVGVDLRGTRGVVVRNSVFSELAGLGVDATGTKGAVIESNAFTRTGSDAISGWRPGFTMNSAMTVRNNVIRDSGVVMSGETVLSQPALSSAAIYAGHGSTVSGNVIVNAGYIGILAQAGSVIEKNFVYGACTVLDDCGGIFIQYPNNNNVVRGNTVVRTRGALLGKPASEQQLQAQGIYLDEQVTGALVEDNTVIDAENGILVHVSQRNTIRGNRLFGNRSSQIWLQADVQANNPTRDVVDNIVTDNLLAPTSVSAVGLRLETNRASTAGFGTVDRNRYYDRASPVAVLNSSAAGSTSFTLIEWQQTKMTGLPAGRDAAGSGTSQTPYATYRALGGNLITNPRFQNNGSGWNPWNGAGGRDTLTVDTCTVGPCLRYLSGGTPGQMSSPNFSVTKGQWYRLSFDLQASRDGMAMGAVVRRGGGGTNGYDPVSVRDLPFVTSRNWTRYTTLLQSNLTINARDPATLDLGARLDFSPVPVGQSITLANVELVPIIPDNAASLSGVLVNAGSTVRTWNCPQAATQPALCNKFRRMADDSAITWPVSVPAYSALLFYAQEPALLDSDGDGIADVDDRCAGTPRGAAVNATGCPISGK